MDRINRIFRINRITDSRDALLRVVELELGALARSAPSGSRF